MLPWLAPLLAEHLTLPCAITDLPSLPGVPGTCTGAGLHGVPKEEPGQPAPCQSFPGSQEEPCCALRAHVLPAFPVVLQVSVLRSRELGPGKGSLSACLPCRSAAVKQVKES